MNKGKAAILMAGCLVFLNLSAFAQAVSLKMNNVEVKKAISELKANTGYSFVYASGDIDTKKTVSVNAVDLKQAIEQIIAGQDLSYEIQGKNIIIKKTVHKSADNPDNKSVKGKVLDKSGLPVVGAGVFEKGSSKGVVSDLNGDFVLEGVSEGTVLTVSCIGYSSQDVVYSGKAVNIILDDDIETLQDVVVIGYGTMKKSDLTGSVVKADLSSVKTAPNSNILQALQGNVAGLQIGQVNTAGAEPSVEIRGQITLSGSTDPLVVLDGIIYNGKLSDLSPSDIESIDILKDASSKAVYGARAANGVLMVTTKTGRHEMAPKITFSTNWSWSNPTKDFRPLNRDEWMKKARDVDYENAYTASSGYLEINPNWSFTSTGMTEALAQGIENGTDYDWWRNGTQTGHLHTNTVNVSGGTQNISYFVSGGYTDQSGIVKNDDYKRTTLRTNFDVQITPWLKVGNNTFLAFSDYSGESPTIGTLMRIPTVAACRDTEGNWITNPTGANLLNPLMICESQDDEKRQQINTTVYGLVSFPFLPGLTYRLNYNYVSTDTHHYNFNQYEASFKGEAYKNSSSDKYWLLDNILNYSRTFNRHSVNATLVYGANRRNFENTKAEGQQYSNSALGYNKLEQAVIQKISSSAWAESNVYQMARLAYNYDGRYFLTATIRRDGFSGFAANHKFGYFPSFGLAWTISNEPWMKNVTSLDNLKLRASYGATGNQTLRYSSLAQVAISDGYVYGDGGQTAKGTYVSSMANSDLSWEKTKELNFGIDFAFFNSRLNGSVDYYNSITTDLLWDVALPSMTGFTSVRSNVGKINNRGIEVTINGTPVRTRDFEWNINVNFAANKNRVVSLLGEDKDGDGKEDDLVSSNLFIGESIGTIYGYEVEGIWQLEDQKNGTIMEGFYPGTYKIKDQDGDGKITAAHDRIILGHSEPVFTMGIKNNLTFKGFDFNFFINIINGGKTGYLAYNEKYNQAGNSKGNATNQNWMNCYDYWTPSNPDAKFATAWLSPAIDADQLQSRSFVRLQDISLGYTFSNRLLQKAKIQNLRLYVSGKNLLTFTKWDGWDPEMGLGVCSSAYPVMKTFAFGAEITF